jgi:hypothetical protein
MVGLQAALWLGWGVTVAGREFQFDLEVVEVRPRGEAGLLHAANEDTPDDSAADGLLDLVTMKGASEGDLCDSNENS